MVAAGVGGYRSIYVSTSCRHKKKPTNPEEDVLVNKTNQRSTNKKTYMEKKIKQKRTVWGVIDVYRFITVEKLASLMRKTIGNERLKDVWVCDNVLNRLSIYSSDEMQEILLYYPEIKDIRPSAKIEDMHLIKEIAYRFGYKIRPVTPPDVEEKQEIVRLALFHLISFHFIVIRIIISPSF